MQEISIDGSKPAPDISLSLPISPMKSRVSFPRILFPVVSEGAASDSVDNDEEDEEDDVDHSHPFPVTLDVIK